MHLKIKQDAITERYFTAVTNYMIYFSLLCPKKHSPGWHWNSYENVTKNWRQVLVALSCVPPRPGKGARFGEVSFAMSYCKSISMQRYPCENANKNRPQRCIRRLPFQGLDLLVIYATWRFNEAEREQWIRSEIRRAFYSCLTFIFYINPAKEVILFSFYIWENWGGCLPPKPHKASGRDRIRRQNS